METVSFDVQLKDGDIFSIDCEPPGRLWGETRNHQKNVAGFANFGSDPSTDECLDLAIEQCRVGISGSIGLVYSNTGGPGYSIVRD